MPELPLEAFGRGWVVLPKAPISLPGEPPVLIDIVLLHARRGVALLEAPPHWTPDAPRRLRRRLEHAQFSAIYPGYLPIVHLQLLRGALSELPRVLAAAFEAEPPLGLPGGDAWMRAAGRALATAQAVPAAAPPAPGPRIRLPASPAVRGAAGLALVAAVGLGALALRSGSPAGDATILAGAEAAAPKPAEGVAPPVLPPPPPPPLAMPAVLHLAPDLKGPDLSGTADLLPPSLRPGPATPDPAAPDPELLDVLRDITARALPQLVLAGPDATAQAAPDVPAPPGPAPVPALAVPAPAAVPPPGAAEAAVPRHGLPALPALAPLPPPPLRDDIRGASPPTAPPPPVAALAEPAEAPALTAPPRVEADAQAAPAVVPPRPTAAEPPAAPARSTRPEGDRAAALPDRAVTVPAAVPAEPPAPAARATDPALLAALLRRGDALLAIGDVSGARRFYERAAEAGSAEGARAAGRTHDPAVLATLGMRSIRPDPDAAVAWYRRADALAATEPRR